MENLDLGSSWTWTDARRRGATRRQIAEGGELLTRSLYLSRAEPSSLAVRCRAWVRLLPSDAAFGLETGATLLGAHTDPPPEVQVVLRPRPVLPQRRGLAVAVRRLTGDDVVVHEGLRVTSGAQTLLDLAPRLPPAELVAVGDAMLRAGHLTDASLRARLARADRVRGVVRARACADLLDARAMSRPESLLRYWLATSDLPAPQVQLPITDRTGRVVAHADLGWERHRIAVEYEGRQHAEAGQFGRDVDRYSLMGAGGWLVLRFAARHLGGPAVVVERSRAALLGRGWRPGAVPS
ncbi:endonuclease domain-containing protein [Geodermatophilus sp. SYSU D00814]